VIFNDRTLADLARERPTTPEALTRIGGVGQVKLARYGAAVLEVLHGQDQPTIIDRARALRSSMSPPEVLLWTNLRGRALGGLKFRRQHPIGRYLLDFYCPEARLVIEVDGEGHSQGDQPQRDERRDAWLRDQGLEVLRVRAADVMASVVDVADGILRIAGERAPPIVAHRP
jgi:very-short-patch-repair endonuclease